MPKQYNFLKLLALIIEQWLIIKNMYSEKSIDEIFLEACGNGFLSYAIFFLKGNKIDIHAYNEEIFIYSCENGHIQIANW